MIARAVNRMASGALVMAMLWAASLILGPYYEMRILGQVPINDLYFDKMTCVGDDAIIEGVLDKARFPNGQEALFRNHDGLTIRPAETFNSRTFEVLEWRPVEADQGKRASRPAGVQDIAVYVFDGCNRSMIMRTRHISPVSGRVLPMTFGPFFEDLETTKPR